MYYKFKVGDIVIVNSNIKFETYVYSLCTKIDKHNKYITVIHFHRNSSNIRPVTDILYIPILYTNSLNE